MIYQEKPINFNSKYDVVSCFVEHDGEILLLHRQDHKPEGSTWGVPAGKVDGKEKISETMVRELREETGFEIPPLKLKYFGKIYVKYPDRDFIYHMFSTNLDKKQKVVINFKEHKDFKWISPKSALNISLVPDLDSCIKLFYEI